jgi:predicted N-acetyltransferase YhbS
MLIETASWDDILPILRTNFRIWSPGLSQSDYRHYIWSQLQSPWSRQNLRYVIDRMRGETRASCKTYQLILKSGGKSFRFAVLGAVYTPEKFRGQGFATDLIEGLIDRFQEQSFDGLLLFSDIDPEFYASLGFDQMGGSEFVMFLPDEAQAQADLSNNENDFVPECIEYHTLTKTKEASTGQIACGTSRLDPGLDEDVIANMTRHYARWLRRQPFGIERSEDYFAYKLGKERFIAMHSKLSWPEMIVTIVKLETNEYAYSLTECSGMTMRVLEVIGSQTATQVLWKELYRKAVKTGIRRIRGWESIIREFAPTYSYRPILPEASGLKTSNCKILSFERDWGRPMLFAFNDQVRFWFRTFPCPLLELDL